MICSHCGQRIKLSLEEKNKRISIGLKNSLRTGRKRKYDYESIKAMHESGYQISEIAEVIGASVATVSKIINRGENR